MTPDNIPPELALPIAAVLWALVYFTHRNSERKNSK